MLVWRPENGFGFVDRTSLVSLCRLDSMILTHASLITGVQQVGMGWDLFFVSN